MGGKSEVDAINNGGISFTSKLRLGTKKGDVSTKNDESTRVTHKKPRLGRSHSLKVVSLSHRPSTNTRRTKSLGTLDYLLSKVSSEFEELLERDKEATNEAAIEKNPKSVPVRYMERWKQARNVSSRFTHISMNDQ